MRVALFASSFHPHVGGVEEVVRQLAHEQRRQGGDPLILTMRWPKSLPRAEEYEGLPVIRHVFRVPQSSWRHLPGWLLFRQGTLTQVCANVRSHRCEMLHVHCVSGNAYYALQVKRRLGLPLVVTLHGELTMDASHIFERSAFFRQLLRRVLTEADLITAVSRSTLADAEAFLGRSLADRASVVYNGVSLEGMAEAPVYNHPRPYILAIGRLVPQKGFDVLLRSFAACASACDLLIAGDGPERQTLAELAVQLGIEESVRFLGQVDRRLARSLYKSSSFVVLPSVSDEGLPMVTLEAAAAGKALVASRTGGVPEAVVDGVTGILVPRGDVVALSNAMARLTDDTALRGRLGAAAAERAKDFSWPAIAAQYESLYASLL